jgi:1L-myo-inositol 1-phosphate cytidylyltransferase / CDP-L-myo-inositol myo-inositolphosphotransferase
MADTLDRPEITLASSERPIAPAGRVRVGVILAAGRSERLAAVTGGGSKAVMRVAGLSLVERAVRTLLAAGISDVVVVVGHEAGPVAAVAKRVAPNAVRAVYAERWEDGNGASLAAAAPFVAEEDLFVLMTADHVFGEGVLDRLLECRTAAVLVDHAPERAAWAEGTRVRLDGERAVAFSKELGDPSIDCGAFLLPTSVFEAQRRAAERGDSSLAGAVTELVATTGITAVALPHGAWWQDVDTPEDLRNARRLLRASLTKRSDGPVSRYLNRPISTRLSIALSPLRPHPDLVSLVSFAVAIVGAVAIASGSGIVGGLLVQLASILDGTDGELARLQVRASQSGALLDGMLDRVGDAAVIAGCSLWALERGGATDVVLVAAIAATAASMLSMASKDRITALGMPSAPEHALGWLFGGRDARLLILAVCAIAGRPLLGLIAVAVTGLVSSAVRVLMAEMTAHVFESRTR